MKRDRSHSLKTSGSQKDMIFGLVRLQDLLHGLVANSTITTCDNDNLGGHGHVVQLLNPSFRMTLLSGVLGQTLIFVCWMLTLSRAFNSVRMDSKIMLMMLRASCSYICLEPL